MPPQAPPQGGGQGGGDNSLAPLWISIAVFVAFGILWIYGQSYIVAAVFAVRQVEANLINLFLPQMLAGELNQATQYMSNTHPANYNNVSFGDLVWISSLIGDYLRYPTVLILGGLALVLYVKNPTLRFRKNYDMRRLVDEEKTNWPQIMPIAKLNLVEQNINEGPWAMAMAPMDFAKKYKLVIEDPQTVESAILKSKKIRTASINREDARKIFAMQLGPYWTRIEELPIHTQALFAIFAARLGQDRDGAAALLRQLSLSTNTTLDFSGVKPLLEKHKNHKRVVSLVERHAFVLTVMPSMLQTAREDGVLACADFLWLKPIDRPLWFMLDNVGRQTAFTEVAGPFAHWLAEKTFGARLNIPMVEEAVNGLEFAIKDIIYKPDDE